MLTRGREVVNDGHKMVNVVWERPPKAVNTAGSSWLVEQFFRRKESLLVSSFLLKDSPYCSAYFQSII
jgi:hypothetical protein